ncbi:MAG TPA: NAD-dependent epimerase/dehydratase family protein [Candidatus Nanoarchaeia archaeon]|nr:NAD-dependent epimerase/dehydratase family protein [Candidatus Nanoarchaeia archaeon]
MKKENKTKENQAKESQKKQKQVKQKLLAIKNIVLLGHTGFVGNRIKTYFKEKHPELNVIGISSQDIDLTNAEQCLKLKDYFNMESLVIMCSGIKSNYGNDLDIYSKNVAMAANVCKILSSNPVKKLIFFSSIAVYGVDVDNMRMTESTPLDPDTYYGLSKLDSERLLSFEFSKLKDSSLIILRPSTIYGPGEKIIAPTPSGFLIKYLEGGEVTLWGDGSEHREFLFIEDLVRLIELLAFSDFNGIINLSGDKPYSYIESLEIISRLLGKKLSIHHKPRTKSKVDKAYEREGSLLKTLFPNFKFTSLEEGLRCILNSRKGKDHYKRVSCRLCNSDKLVLVVPIGESPVGGAFVTKDKLKQKQATYPLDLYQCNSCGHVQLLDVVDPNILFSSAYSYFSGKTSLIKHFANYSKKVMDENKLKKGMFVVDIGSNDGAFLGFFKEKGIRTLGIDPASNVAEYANKQGIETLPVMFDMKAVEYIKEKYSKADIITANNVFAHADNLKEMAAGVRELLKKDGLFYFEVSYLLDVIDKMLLGTIIHEHLCYHTIKPLALFLRNQGLELIDVERVSIQGGSIICKAQLLGGRRSVSPLVDELIRLEESRGVYHQGFFDSFNKRLAELKKELNESLRSLEMQGKKIAGFGAARGGTLITYLFDLGKYMKYIVDDDETKQGFYSPGFHIPVLPTSAMYERKPDYVIILAWVHSKSIIKNNRKYLENGGKFITFFPKIEVIDKDSKAD